MDAEIDCRTPTDYAEMALRPLEAEQCVLVVIDIQQKLLPAIFQKEQLVRNAQLLIRAAAILKVPAVVSTQNAKGLGGTVPEVASLLVGTELIDKTLFSCFGSDVFCSALKRLPGQRNTLLLCGMESHICVTQTALGALRQGYLVQRGIRRGQFADGVELEDRAGAHASCGRGDFVDRDDDL